MTFRYQAFGVSFELPFRATTRLEATERTAELRLSETERTPSEPGDLLYQHPRRLQDGSPAVSYRRGRVGDVLRFAGAVEFQAPTAPKVEFRRLGSLSDEQVEAFVLSSLLPLRVELKGMISLHCSAVRVAGGVVGFLGNSGAGKSSLAAALLGRGHALVAEDVLPVWSGSTDRIHCISAYPEIKLASPLGEHFFGSGFRDLREESFPGGKRRVPLGETGLASFASGRHDLAALFVLDRRPKAPGSLEAGAAISVERLGGRQAALELLRFSFHANLVEALGLTERRLEALARVVERVPVSRLRYPSGIEPLGKLCPLVEDRAGRPDG